jgi:hypothetical protein
MFYTYFIDVFSLKMILKGSKLIAILSFGCKIIYCNIVHFVGYLIKNRHLIHGSEYHKM